MMRMMRLLDTLEPGERFTTSSFGLTGTVIAQHDGSTYVRWDKGQRRVFGESLSRVYREHISRKTEVE